MYRTKLFEVVVHEVVCHDPRNVDYRMMAPFDIRLPVDGSDKFITPVREVYLPRHRICQRTRAGSVVETFIAISPELLPLVEAPFRSRIESLERNVTGAVNKIIECRQEIATYQDRITQHNSLPWYRRWFHRV